MFSKLKEYTELFAGSNSSVLNQKIRWFESNKFQRLNSKLVSKSSHSIIQLRYPNTHVSKYRLPAEMAVFCELI